jgi:hypothetical protein
LVKYPDLEGKLDDFKVYSSEDSKTSIPFEVLVPAFLQTMKAPVKNKGEMFPKGSAGASQAGKIDNRLTIEEGRKLRETDQRKWKEYLKEGRIRIDL